MVSGVLTVAGVIVVTFLTQAVEGEEDCPNTVKNSTEWCENDCCGDGGSNGEEEVCCGEEFPLIPVIVFGFIGGMVVLFVLFYCFQTQLTKCKDAMNKVAAGSSASLHYYRTSAPEEVNATTDPEQPPPPQPAPYETAYKRPTNPQPAVPAYHLPALPTDHQPAVPANSQPTVPAYHLPAVPTGPLPGAPSALYADNAAPPNYQESCEPENAAKGPEAESEPPSYSSLFQVKS